MKRKQFIIGGSAILLMPHILLPKKRKPALTPKQEWDQWATDAQKRFARKCIRYGQRKTPARGHTLAGLAWMETALNFFKEHNERSYGPFGIALVTAYYIRKKLRKDPKLGDLEDWSDETLISMLKTFEYASDMAIWLFEYHRQWFLTKGYGQQQSWKYAAQRYAGWKRWASRKSYGRVFNARVKFLKTNTDWGNPSG